ncbi:MAG: hypothetical protein SGILL_004591, partial [Bacillariaceae sp.]
MNLDNESTAPPSFGELPPEKGTILELHSIGHDDWNGKLVEFHSKEKGTDNFFVRFYPPKEDKFDDSAGGIRVKSKCCRRPAMKPLKFRGVIAKLSHNLYRDKDFYSPSIEQRLHDILEKDPCCCLAHYALGFRESFMAVDNPSPEEEDAHLQRS